MNTLEQLWDSTGQCHSTIQNSCFFLRDIANQVEYLHPDLARTICKVADTIEDARQTIQGNAAQEVNMRINDQETSFATTLDLCLKRLNI